MSWPYVVLLLGMFNMFANIFVLLQFSLKVYFFSCSKTTRGQIRFTIFTGTKNKFFYNIIFLHTSSSPVLSFVLMWLYLEAIKETVPTLNCARQGKGVSLAAGEQSEQNLTLGHICMRFCGPVFSLSPPPSPLQHQRQTAALISDSLLSGTENL